GVGATPSTTLPRLKFSTRSLRCLASYLHGDNPYHAFRESTVKVGHYDFPGFCCEVHGPSFKATIPNVEDISHQPATRFDRRLHGTHHLVRDSVRLCRTRPSSSTYRAF